MKFRQFLFLFFLIPGSLFGQKKEYIFKNFTQEEGLPSNEAYYIFEDSRHFLWFATDLGVVRYNGSKFEQFNLPDNVVFKIREDSKGRIWFFSHKAQLAYFENEKVHVYKYNDAIARRITKINIVEAYVDDNENITLNSSIDSNFVIDKTGLILGKQGLNSKLKVAKISLDTTSSGALRITEKYTAAECDTFHFSLPNSQNHKLSIPVEHSTISHYGEFTDQSGDIYFFAGKLLFKLFKKGGYKIKYFPNDILCLENFKDQIWVGMIKKGAVLINSDLSNISTDTVLINKSVTSIKKDYEGGVWFATLENGIFYGKNLDIHHYTMEDASDKNISRIAIFRNTSLVYSNSKGIFNFQNKKRDDLILQLANNNISDIIASNSILYILAGSTDIKGFNTNRFLYKNIELCVKINSPSEGLIKRNDSFIYSRSDQTVLFKSKLIHKDGSTFDPNFNLFFKEILDKQTKLFQDLDGSIWGGSNVGLYRTKGNNFDTLVKVFPNDKLLEKGITCIRQMNNGLIVTGIRFGGIALISNNKIVANITEQEGLLSDKVRYILPQKNQLWVATAKGISVITFSSFNPVKFAITNIGKNDGFYNVTINQLIQFKGNIVAATSNGLYFIQNPDELINRKPIPIPFYINTITYYKGDTSAIQTLTLPYSKSRVLLKYSAACFNSAEEVKYQYTFSNEDTGWATTTSTELLLENLEPGDYNLKIKAVIPNQNRSSEIQYFKITVNKPWWQNNWFRAAVILSFIAAGFFITRYRITKVKNEEERKTKLNSKIAELEQTALRAQMNPHFIFNCLTSIQQLIVTGNKVEANEYLVKFSRLIRKTLDLSANPFISIREEMDYLNEYLFLEQLRIAGHFEYFINANENINTDKILIPNMMIQPVVENCIRHGIKSLEDKKGIVDIHFSLKDNKLFCTVKDNGIGRKNSITTRDNSFTKHKSYGIDIIEKRLKVFTELNDEEMGIEIKDLYTQDGSAAGTEVTLQLPFKTIV